MRTRSQVNSEQVYVHVQQLKQAIDEEQDEIRKAKLNKQAKQYGSLCHNFPLLVLKSGLSQAVSFVWVKSKGKNDTPHAKFLKHLSSLTEGNNETPEAFQQRINTAELMNYQRLTRKILTASIWYKRFAESILDVKAGEDVPEEAVNANH